MPASSASLVDQSSSSTASSPLESLWDSGQEWILIFDNLLKHPGGRPKGCRCDICLLDKGLDQEDAPSPYEPGFQRRRSSFRMPAPAVLDYGSRIILHSHVTSYHNFATLVKTSSSCPGVSSSSRGRGTSGKRRLLSRASEVERGTRKSIW